MVTPNLKTKLKNSFRQMTTERTPHQPLPENIRHVTTFLRKIRTHFPISLIYYPGCGGDQILEKAFKPWEIIYVDKDANRSRYGSRLKQIIDTPHLEMKLLMLYFTEISMRKLRNLTNY